MDAPPLAGPDDAALWHRTRRAYEAISRSSQFPIFGRPIGILLDALTSIPRLYPHHDLSAPTAGVRALERLYDRGLGDRLLAHLKRGELCLLTTFFGPAVLADLAGWDRIVCVVTDSDINRAWAPRHARLSRIHYCVPSERARRRLLAFGVPADHVHFTGFPLPTELTGDHTLKTLRKNLASRLARLDPTGVFADQFGLELGHFALDFTPEATGGPPTLTFAIGGAGAQAHMVRPALASLHPLLREGRLRLALVAGTRRKVADLFIERCTEAHLGDLLGGAIEIVCGDDFNSYYREFNNLLARTDILWTKPSELTFYGALGLPLVFSRPVGEHERSNRRWAMERGAGIVQEDPDHVGTWLGDTLADGTLASAAWAAYVRMPKFGTTRIIDVAKRIVADAKWSAGGRSPM